jgi:hypothetical protein
VFAFVLIIIAEAIKRLSNVYFCDFIVNNCGTLGVYSLFPNVLLFIAEARLINVNGQRRGHTVYAKRTYL